MKIWRKIFTFSSYFSQREEQKSLVRQQNFDFIEEINGFFSIKIDFECDAKIFSIEKNIEVPKDSNFIIYRMNSSFITGHEGSFSHLVQHIDYFVHLNRVLFPCGNANVTAIAHFVQIWCGFWTRIMTYPSMSLVITVAVHRLFRLLLVHAQRKVLASKYLSRSSVFNFRRPNVCPSYSSRGNPVDVSVIFAKMENSPVKYKRILINRRTNRMKMYFSSRFQFWK